MSFCAFQNNDPTDGLRLSWQQTEQQTEKSLDLTQSQKDNRLHHVYLINLRSFRKTAHTARTFRCQAHQESTVFAFQKRECLHTTSKRPLLRRGASIFEAIIPSTLRFLLNTFYDGETSLICRASYENKASVKLPQNRPHYNHYYYCAIDTPSSQTINFSFIRPLWAID